MLNKQLWVLVLRTMIAVGVQNELRVRQVLLEDERVHCINDHVVAAVHHERGLSDLLQVKCAAFVLAEALCHGGRSRSDGDLRGQRPFVGDKRGSTASRWWCREGHPINEKWKIENEK